MKSLTTEQLTSYLINKWEYPRSQAPETALRLQAMAPEILQGFAEWLDSGEFPDEPVYTSYSPRSLRKLTNLKPPAIFLMLDWIRREPQEATRAMREELLTK